MKISKKIKVCVVILVILVAFWMYCQHVADNATVAPSIEGTIWETIFMALGVLWLLYCWGFIVGIFSLAGGCDELAGKILIGGWIVILVVMYFI